MFPDSLVAEAEKLLAVARAKQLTLATAESCTGGLIAGLLTDIAGSSDVVDRGFVTYSNRAKHEMLGVEEALIDAHGAVSEKVACAMAEGACAKSGATVAVSVTGIAGPGGATPGKPVGLVYIAVCFRGKTLAQEHHFSGNRQAVRLASVKAAIALMLSVIQ